MPSNQLTILLLAASTSDDDRVLVDEEMRAINAVLLQAALRETFDLVPVPAVRIGDLQDRLLRYRPHVIHFCGRSPVPGSIELRDDDGQPLLVRATVLSRLLALASQRPHCLVFNGSYTKTLARPLLATTDCVLGCRPEIDPAAALDFSAGFYLGLGYGRSLATAFGLGRSRIELAGHAGKRLAQIECAGIDPATVRLTPIPVAMEGGAPWRMPYPRNHHFFDRETELASLHTALASGPLSRAPGLPVAVTGLGGIGKTELAIEYCYRHRATYPGGSFWVNAATDWLAEFAALGECLQPWVADQPAENKAAAAAAYLQSHPDSLLVLDGVDDVSQLRRLVTPGLVPAALPCRLLLTMRSRPGRSARAIELDSLPERAGLALLLHHPARQPVLAPDHPEHAAALAIVHLLGGLPLALEVAGAFLGEWPAVTVAGYLERLRRRGTLATLDAEGAELPRTALSGVHPAAVAATLAEQWDALHPDRPVDADARLLLRTAALLPEAAETPLPRLALLTGVPDSAEPGEPSHLDRAVRRLEQAALVQSLRGNALNLHPLVREFAGAQTAPEDRLALRLACVQRLTTAYADLVVLERHAAQRGIGAVEQDVRTTIDLARDLPGAEPALDLLFRLLRLLRHEGHTLRHWDPVAQPAAFLQQWRKRALVEGELSYAAAAATTIANRNQPWLSVQWLAVRPHRALERYFGRHRGVATAVVATPDGRYVLSAGIDGTVNVWLAEAFGHLRVFTAPAASAIYCLAVTPDSRRVLAGTAAGAIDVWDIGTGALLFSLAGHSAPVRSLAVSPDGRRALSAADDKTVKLWDLARRTERRTLIGHTGRVSAVTFAGAGRLAVSGSADRTVRIWNLQSGRCLHVLRGHTAAVRSVTLSPHGRHLLSGAWDRTWRLWSLDTGEALAIYDHPGGVYTTAFTSDGQHILTGGEDHNIHVWNKVTGALEQSLAGHTNAVRSLAVLPKGAGQRVASAGADNSVRLWNLAAPVSNTPAQGHAFTVSSVAIAPSGSLGLSVGTGSDIKVWDLAIGRELATLTQPGHRPHAATVLPDSRTALVGTLDGIIAVWDLAAGTLLHSWQAHTKEIRSLAVTPDGRTLVSTAEDRTPRLWELPSGRLLHTLTGHTANTRTAAITPDGRFALTCATDRAIIVWDLATGARVRTLLGHTAGVYTVAMVPGRPWVLSGGWADDLRLWDWRTGELLRVLSGHVSGVPTVAVSPDASLALSASWDSTVNVWNLATGQMLASLGFDDIVTALAAAPDGRTFLAGDQAGGVYCLRWEGDA